MFVVCGSLGGDTFHSSVPYVAGWGEDGALDAIRGFAQTIDEIARRIEDSVRPAEQDAPASQDLRGSDGDRHCAEHDLQPTAA